DDPLNSMFRSFLGVVLCLAGDVGAAEKEARQVLEMDPDFIAALMVAGEAYGPSGRGNDALAVGGRAAAPVHCGTLAQACWPVHCRRRGTGHERSPCWRRIEPPTSMRIPCAGRRTTRRLGKRSRLWSGSARQWNKGTPARFSSWLPHEARCVHPLGGRRSR